MFDALVHDPSLPGFLRTLLAWLFGLVIIM